MILVLKENNITHVLLKELRQWIALVLATLINNMAISESRQCQQHCYK